MHNYPSLSLFSSSLSHFFLILIFITIIYTSLSLFINITFLYYSIFSLSPYLSHFLLILIFIKLSLYLHHHPTSSQSQSLSYFLSISIIIQLSPYSPLYHPFLLTFSCVESSRNFRVLSSSAVSPFFSSSACILSFR